MRILALNAGSSSLKWSMLSMPTETVEAGGDIPLTSDAAADFKPILDRGAPDAVVHRVVHGGVRFKEATRIDPATLEALEELRSLAPLHTGRAIQGIRAVTAAMPGVPQVACFDTAFHQRMPAHASRYAIPEEWTRTLGIRRYGFHGLSVAYSISEVARRIRPTPPRIVVCHLGSGCSITAVDRGRSADTTMGFTPLEGVMMGTRAGSLDPGLLLYLARDKGIPLEVIDRRLENESGLLGVSGVSGDLREVIAASDKSNPKAALAYRMFIHSICRNLGAMLGALGGTDVLVFTGGIGEHNPLVRAEVAGSFAWAGVRIDPAANVGAQGDAEITQKPRRTSPSATGSFAAVAPGPDRRGATPATGSFAATPPSAEATRRGGIPPTGSFGAISPSGSGTGSFAAVTPGQDPNRSEGQGLKDGGVRVLVVSAREDLVMAREALTLLEPHEASLA